MTPTKKKKKKKKISSSSDNLSHLDNVVVGVHKPVVLDQAFKHNTCFGTAREIRKQPWTGVDETLKRGEKKKINRIRIQS